MNAFIENTQIHLELEVFDKKCRNLDAIFLHYTYLTVVLYWGNCVFKSVIKKDSIYNCEVGSFGNQCFDLLQQQASNLTKIIIFVC